MLLRIRLGYGVIMLGLFKWIILGDEIYIIYILVNSNHGKRPTIKIQPSDFAAKVSAAPVDSQRKNVGQTSKTLFILRLPRIYASTTQQPKR